MKPPKEYLIGYTLFFFGLVSLEILFFKPWIHVFVVLNPIIVGFTWLAHEMLTGTKTVPIDQGAEDLEHLLMQIDHEILNPIAALKISVESLEEDGYSQPVAHAMKKAIDRLESVNQLYLRLLCMNTSSHLPMASIDFAELIRRALIDEASSEVLSSTQFVVKIPENPLWITGNEQLLYDAFKQLFKYVLYSKDNHTQILLTLSKHATHLSLSIEQHGNTPSMKKDLLAQQILSLHAGDQRSGKPLGATGLALTLIKRVVEHHEGLIDYQYCDQKTTRYHVTLPLTRLDHKIIVSG